MAQTKKNIDSDSGSVSQGLLARSRKAIRAALDGMHPGNIADALESIPAEDRARVWNGVPVAKKGEVLFETRKEVREHLIELSKTTVEIDWRYLSKSLHSSGI